MSDGVIYGAVRRRTRKALGVPVNLPFFGYISGCANGTGIFTCHAWVG